MFVLREVFPDGTESNRYLGDHYTVTAKSLRPIEFDECVKDVYDVDDFESMDPKPNIYGFIRTWDIESAFPLYKGNKNYIVTENGNTYDNVSESPRFC